MTSAFGLSLAELAIVLAFIGVVAERIVDSKGWARSSKTLRRENEDLVRRNRGLEETVARHEQTILEQAGKIAALDAKVVELEKRDQAAVLEAIERHEASAAVRHTESAARHMESLAVFHEIRDHLKGAAA